MQKHCNLFAYISHGPIPTRFFEIAALPPYLRKSYAFPMMPPSFLRLRRRCRQGSEQGDIAAGELVKVDGKA
jgi:hypothetical protein